MLNNNYYKYLSPKSSLRILKSLLETDSESKRKLLFQYYSICGMSRSNINTLNAQYSYVKRYQDEVSKNKIVFHNELDIYNKILNSMVKLMLELKLSNSLECSNLFAYLLWNGYLSKNHELFYDTKKLN